MHFFDFFEFSFYIICLYTGHFIIVKFCQKAEKINFIKFWPLIKSPGPFCHSSAEPKSQIFGNFSSNLWRTNLKSLWGRHGTLVVILMYVCINPKMSPIRDPVRGRKNAPIDCCRYTENSLKCFNWYESFFQIRFYLFHFKLNEDVDFFLSQSLCLILSVKV